MYRRIEQIMEWRAFHSDGTPNAYRYSKLGLCGVSTEVVLEAWIDLIQAPGVSIPANCRFYFTEKGWALAGRKVIAACQRSGQQYRVLRIKEHDLDVVYRDEYQVAGQPKRKGVRAGRKRKPDGWKQELDEMG